jgi:cytochrome c-type biogenesis protein
LLPAFLSFYLGADEDQLPRAPTRAVQGLAVGGLVAAGFLGFFAAVGLPVSFGVGAIADAVPWTGLVAGCALTLAGLAALAGRRLSVRVPRVPVRRERRLAAMVLFGVAYGAASLGCTLPVFLAVVGASLGGDKLGVFAAYAAGMTVVLTALAVVVALARGAALRAVRPASAWVGRVAGALLVASGGYLVYYWGRIRFGETATLADDPVVSFVTRFSVRVEDFAEGRGSAIVAVAGAVVAVTILAALWQRRRSLVRRLASE